MTLYFYEFFKICIFFVFSFFLGFLILIASYRLTISNPDSEKLSSYECGFDPYGDARNTFDIRFYLIAILFIVFDIETMFLIPWTNVLAQLDLVGFWSMIDFMFELSIGYVYIYCIGALDIH